MTQEALKLAIQLRDTASGYWTENEIPIIEKLIELLAQTQEPVAWRSPNWGHSMDEWVYRDADDPVLTADGKPSPSNEPLYTTPPQRTWVRLDHQDKKKFSSWLDHKTDDEVFTAIDDLLREMNT